MIGASKDNDPSFRRISTAVLLAAIGFRPGLRGTYADPPANNAETQNDLEGAAKLAAEYLKQQRQVVALEKVASDTAALLEARTQIESTKREVEAELGQSAADVTKAVVNVLELFAKDGMNVDLDRGNVPMQSDDQHKVPFDRKALSTYVVVATANKLLSKQVLTNHLDFSIAVDYLRSLTVGLKEIGGDGNGFSDAVFKDSERKSLREKALESAPFYYLLYSNNVPQEKREQIAIQALADLASRLLEARTRSQQQFLAELAKSKSSAPLKGLADAIEPFQNLAITPELEMEVAERLIAAGSSAVTNSGGKAIAFQLRLPACLGLDKEDTAECYKITFGTPTPSLGTPAATNRKAAEALVSLSRKTPDRQHDASISTGKVVSRVTEASLTASWGEMIARDNARIESGKLSDGAEARLIGREFIKDPEHSRPIILVLGVGTTRQQMVDAAIALSKSTGRSVIPIINDTAAESWKGLVKAFSPESVFNDKAEILGVMTDGFRTIWDRCEPRFLAVEPATKTLYKTIVERVSKGENVDVVLHSQGTVIAQNALREFVADLDSAVAKGTMTAQTRSAMLGRINIVAAGVFADARFWPDGVKVSLINNPGDPIAAMSSFEQLKIFVSADKSMQAHYFVKSYVGQVATELNCLEATRTLERVLNKKVFAESLGRSLGNKYAIAVKDSEFKSFCDDWQRSLNETTSTSVRNYRSFGEKVPANGREPSYHIPITPPDPGRPPYRTEIRPGR
jgi:hypothetical protein